MEAMEIMNTVDLVLGVVASGGCIALVVLVEKFRKRVLARVDVHEDVFPEWIAEVQADAKLGLMGFSVVSDGLCEYLDKVTDDGR